MKFKFLKQNKEWLIFSLIGLITLALFSYFYLNLSWKETLTAFVILSLFSYGAYRYNKWLKRTKEEPHSRPFGSN